MLNNYLLINYFALFMLGVVAPVYADSVTKQKITDTTITASIRAEMAQDNLARGLEIHIMTKNGLVILEGMVNSKTEYAHILMLVNSINGVQEVDVKNLKVKSSRQFFKDTQITAQIKGRLIRRKLLSKGELTDSSVTVETNNGNVYLSGSVKNHEQIDKIIKIAEQTVGVKHINSTALTIK